MQANKIITRSSVDFPYKDGVGTFLYTKMSEAKNKPAQIDGLTGKTDTYQSLLKRCVYAAMSMQVRGITHKDVVAICSQNHLDTIVPLLASYFIGATPTFIDFTLTPPETKELLQRLAPKTIYVEEIFLAKVLQTGVESEIVIFGTNLLPETEVEHFEPVPVKNLNEVAGIVFTSGTTGTPKEINLSHKALLASTIYLTKLSVVPNYVTISPIYTYWISFSNWLFNAIISQSCRVLVPNFDCCNMWDLIDKYQVSVLMLSPYLIPTVLNRTKTYESSLALIIVAGANCTRNQIVTLRKFLPETLVLPAYGQTELGGMSISFNYTNPNDIHLSYRNPTSCGRPLPGYSYKIANPDTEEILGPNQCGEVRIKTEYRGYYSSNELDEYDSDGYYKTGDMGYYDDDCCFYVVDRIKEMFKYKGHLVVPFKLECLLKTHDAVKNAVVIGLPHDVDGEHAMGLVVLKKKCVGTVTENELQEYVDDKVRSVEKLRGGVRFVNRLYTTALGKVKRKYMKELLLHSQL